jgi:hypothetical protein
MSYSSPAKYYSIAGSGTPNRPPSKSITPTTPEKPAVPTSNNTSPAPKSKDPEPNKPEVNEPLPEKLDQWSSGESDSGDESSEEESTPNEQTNNANDRPTSINHSRKPQEDDDPPVEMGRLHKICHEMEAIVPLVNESDNSRREEAISMLYSLLDEAFTVLGLNDVLPRTMVVGQQSGGKTSIFEALLRLPIGTPRPEMATKIPQIIRMRSNRHCVQPRISYYWKGIMHPCADPGQLIREVNDINDRVDKIDMEAYIEITIEYAKARTITLIDLPGIFVASSKKNPNISADDIDKLVAKWVLDRPNDRILLIQRMNDDGTTVKAPHMLLGSKEYPNPWDPKLKRTTLVMTHFDMIKTDLEINLNRKIHNVGTKSVYPFVMTLHSIPMTATRGELSRSTGRWQELKAEIEKQQKTNQAADEQKYQQLSESARSDWKNRIGFAAFEKEFVKMVNDDFIKNASSIINIFTREYQKLTQSKINYENLYKQTPEIGSYVRNFIQSFVDSLRDIFGQSDHTDADLDKFGVTLQRDLDDSIQFLQLLPVAVESWPENFNPATLTHIENAEEPLINKLLLERQKVEIKQRYASVNLDDVSKKRFLAAIKLLGDVSVKMSAAGPLLRTEAEKRLATGVDYCVWRVVYSLYYMKELALHELRETYPLLIDNAQFINHFNHVFHQYLLQRGKDTIEKCKGHIDDIVKSHRWNLPDELTTLTSEFMSTQEPTPGKQKQDMVQMIEQVYDVLSPFKDKLLGVDFDSLVKKVFKAARKKKFSKTVKNAFKMAGSESHEVATDELAQLYDHIVAQFDALKSLVTLFIIMSVESNITKELDTTVAKDRLLYKYLDDEISPLLSENNTNHLVDLRELKEEYSKKAEQCEKDAAVVDRLIKAAKAAIKNIADHEHNIALNF